MLNYEYLHFPLQILRDAVSTRTLVTFLFFDYNTANTDQKEDVTLDDRRRDGGTNSTLRTKEQGTHLTLNEHDDD